MNDFGTIEDGFGSCWARCSKDCELEVVRPGKVQCNICDNRCHQCGGETKWYGEKDSPYRKVSGQLCIPCTDKWATRK